MYCCEVSTEKECLVAEYATTKQGAITKAKTALTSISAEPNAVYVALIYREGMASDGGGYPATESRGSTPQAALSVLSAVCSI